MSLKQILFIKFFKTCALHSISDIFSVNIFYYHATYIQSKSSSNRLHFPCSSLKILKYIIIHAIYYINVSHFIMICCKISILCNYRLTKMMKIEVQSPKQKKSLRVHTLSCELLTAACIGCSTACSLILYSICRWCTK